jgi:hypothetical protein
LAAWAKAIALNLGGEGQDEGGLLKTEPMALATGVSCDVSALLGPEASAFGTRKPTFLSDQDKGVFARWLWQASWFRRTGVKGFAINKMLAVCFAVGSQRLWVNFSVNPAEKNESGTSEISLSIPL